MLPENGQRTKDNLTLTPLLQSHTTARQAPTATKVECVMKVLHNSNHLRTGLVGQVWGPLHTWDWEPVTITLQALSLVEKAEPVQVHFFTLRLRDQWSMWMQDGCKSLHGFLHGIIWTTFHGHLDYFPKPLLRGRSNTKPEDHSTPNASQPLIHFILSCVTTRMNKNSLK
jgi:hypothetical protein